MIMLKKKKRKSKNNLSYLRKEWHRWYYTDAKVSPVHKNVAQRQATRKPALLWSIHYSLGIRPLFFKGKSRVNWLFGWFHTLWKVITSTKPKWNWIHLRLMKNIHTLKSTFHCPAPFLFCHKIFMLSSLI